MGKWVDAKDSWRPMAALAFSAIFVLLFVGLWVVNAWLGSRTDSLAKERNAGELAARQRTFEACVAKYTADAGRRDSAKALRNGDARLRYVVDTHQEGADAYVPGIEIVGVSGEGWFPPKELVELVGRLGADENWYWVRVAPARISAGQKSWHLSVSQDDPRRAACRKAQLAYLEAYNRSIPPERVPRRPAPTPDPRFAVAGGRPPAAATDYP